MAIEEKDLVDGKVYGVLDRGGEAWPSAEWCAAFRVFIIHWRSYDGCEIDKRIPIEDVHTIEEFEDVPW